MPKLQEISTTACHRVSLFKYERLACLQNFYAIILLLASEGVEKRFGETVYKKDEEEKKK